MIKIRYILFTFVFMNILFTNVFGQTPKKSDFYYELTDTSGNGQTTYVKVVKISDGEHTFYSKDKLTITKGFFKNGRLINGEQHLYNDRIAFYKNGKYNGYVHVVELPDYTADSTKVKK